MRSGKRRITPDTVTRLGCIVVVDQSGFTQTVLSRGPETALRLIWTIRRVLIPVFRAAGGEVYKIYADNLFIYFDRVNDAVSASIEANSTLSRESVRSRRPIPLKVGIGIGFGPLLYLPSEDDYYGAEVNLSSKLGEDIAAGGQILLTEAAAGAMTQPTPGKAGRRRSTTISGIKVRFQEWGG